MVLVRWTRTSGPACRGYLFPVALPPDRRARRRHGKAVLSGPGQRGGRRHDRGHHPLHRHCGHGGSCPAVRRRVDSGVIWAHVGSRQRSWAGTPFVQTSQWKRGMTAPMPRRRARLASS